MRQVGKRVKLTAADAVPILAEMAVTAAMAK
jgi:hypothetical protein